MKALLKTNIVIVFILINNCGISSCQFESFPKSSLLITGGLNAGYFYREAKKWNESFFDFSSGIGYVINPRNVCGINLEYEINNIYSSSYRYHGSYIMTELYYKRYIFKNSHLDVYGGIGNTFHRNIEQNETITEYRNLKYGGNIGKTLFLTDCIALDFTTGLERYILVLEKYRPELGNMKTILVNFNISFIYYLTIVKHKIIQNEKI